MTLLERFELDLKNAGFKIDMSVIHLVFEVNKDWVLIEALDHDDEEYSVSFFRSSGDFDGWPAFSGALTECIDWIRQNC